MPEIMLHPDRVEKAWGHELIIANRTLGRGGYCGKRMFLRRGYRCSLHWHNRKDEVFFVESGRMMLELSDQADGRLLEHGIRPTYSRRELLPGDTVLILPGRIHRFTGLADTVFFEFSTPDDPEDSHRIEPSGPTP